MVRDPKALAPYLPNEDERVEALHELVPEMGLGDGAPEDRMLQSLCKTICKLFNVPMAGVSLIDRDTYSLKACQGLPPQFKIARQEAMCAWVLVPKIPETLVVEDMLCDQRFKDHPNVPPEAGGLRFYAGAPMISSTNHMLGTVCILDTAPKKLNADDVTMLNNFAEMAIRRLEEKKQPAKAKLNKKLIRSAEETVQPVVLCDLSNYRWWDILYANDSFAEVAGVGHDSLVEASFWKLFRPAGQQTKHKLLEDLEQAIEAKQDFAISIRRRESVLDSSAAASRDATYTFKFRPATTKNLGAHAGRISVPNMIAAVELGATNSSYFFAVVSKTIERRESFPVEEVDNTAKVGLKRLQQTFYSKRYQSNMPITSRQPVDEGISDVSMGVLCCKTDSGLSYRGRWKRKPVFVKVIEAERKDCIRAPAFGLAYVPKEAALCIGLENANLLSTFKIVVENIDSEWVKAWIVKDWASVGTLDDAITRGWLLNKDGTVNWDLLLSTAIQIAQAVVYMHDESVVVGSIDPYSIQLAAKTVDDDKELDGGKKFVIKLQELGRAARTEDFADAAKISVYSHAAPEVFAKHQISRASDVYAFGMLWWELVESQLVWPSLTSEQVQKRAASKQLPTFSADVNPGIKAMLDACLAFKPGQRPSFKQILARLTIMQTELRENKPMRGQSLETVPAPAVRRLFNNMSSTTSIDSSHKSPTHGESPEKRALEKQSKTMLEKASADTEDAQKKSMFKRFASKFKT